MRWVPRWWPEVCEGTVDSVDSDSASSTSTSDVSCLEGPRDPHCNTTAVLQC